MSKLPIIIRREYLQMVAKKSFIVTTVLVPILMIVLCGVLPVMLAEVKSDEKKQVAVVDHNPGSPFASMLSETDEYIFNNINANSTLSDADDLHDYYAQANSDGADFYALVVIPSDFESSAQLNIYSEKSVSMSLEHSLNRSLSTVLRDKRISSYGIDSLQTIIEYCDVDLRIKNVKWSSDGQETLSSADISMILGLILAMLTYMFVLLYGAMIMSGVVEEKTSRIVEVIVSTCKPIELMLGKIIGVALVGLTQIIIWGAILGIVSIVFGISAVASSPELTALATDPNLTEATQAMVAVQGADQGMMSEIMEMLMSINFTMIAVCFVLYFVGGYLLYASIFAAFGSAVDQQSDTAQFQTPIMIIMIFALYAAMFSMENPDGPLAFWCSMVPFTSPIVMMIRLPYDLPLWELFVSLGLLYLTAFGILWLSARIYRTGILMYGRKFTWADIIRWIRQ